MYAESDINTRIDEIYTFIISARFALQNWTQVRTVVIKNVVYNTLLLFDLGYKTTMKYRLNLLFCIKENLTTYIFRNIRCNRLSKRKVSISAYELCKYICVWLGVYFVRSEKSFLRKFKWHKSRCIFLG